MGARSCHADKNQHWFQLPEQLLYGQVGEGLQEVWQGGSKGPSDSVEGLRGLVSRHGAYRVLGGSFHSAPLVQIKFRDRAIMLSSSEAYVNEADWLLNSQAGEFALNAQFAGGEMNREGKA